MIRLAYRERCACISMRGRKDSSSARRAAYSSFNGGEALRNPAAIVEHRTTPKSARSGRSRKRLPKPSLIARWSSELRPFGIVNCSSL